MATVARTSAFPNSTTLRGIHMVAFHKWQSRPPVGRSLFNVHESTQIREHTMTMGGASTFDTKTEGTPLNYTTLNEGFTQTYTHNDYAKGFEITRSMYINDLYGTMDKHAAELGKMAYETEEISLANVFNNGFTVETTPDGDYIFGTAHVRENGDTFANKPASGSDADLSQTSLEANLISFRDQRDGGGKHLAIKPTRLLVADANIYTGMRLLNSTQEPGTDTNAINPMNGALELVTWSFLTDTDAWFLLADNDDHMLMLYDRETFWTDHIYDFDTWNVKFSGAYAQSRGAGSPLGIWGTSGG